MVLWFQRVLLSAGIDNNVRYYGGLQSGLQETHLVCYCVSQRAYQLQTCSELVGRERLSLRGWVGDVRVVCQWVVWDEVHGNAQRRLERQSTVGVGKSVVGRQGAGRKISRASRVTGKWMSRDGVLVLERVQARFGICVRRHLPCPHQSVKVNLYEPSTTKARYVHTLAATFFCLLDPIRFNSLGSCTNSTLGKQDVGSCRHKEFRCCEIILLKHTIGILHARRPRRFFRITFRRVSGLKLCRRVHRNCPTNQTSTIEIYRCECKGRRVYIFPKEWHDHPCLQWV